MARMPSRDIRSIGAAGEERKAERVSAAAPSYDLGEKR